MTGMKPDTGVFDHARVEALPIIHFNPLLELLPELRRPPPDLPKDLFRDPDGTLILDPGNTPEVDRFIALCYELDIVLTSDWNAFVRQHPFHEQHALIHHFDRYQCCMALTALVRGDRFTSGLVDEEWRKGTLERLVERLAKLG